MIYVSLSTIPPRLKNLQESIESLLKQTKKPDKIFINIPYKYERFNETIEENKIPKFKNIDHIMNCQKTGKDLFYRKVQVKKVDKNFFPKDLLKLMDENPVYYFGTNN